MQNILNFQLAAGIFSQNMNQEYNRDIETELEQE